MLGICSRWDGQRSRAAQLGHQPRDEYDKNTTREPIDTACAENESIPCHATQTCSWTLLARGGGRPCGFRSFPNQKPHERPLRRSTPRHEYGLYSRVWPFTIVHHLLWSRVSPGGGCRRGHAACWRRGGQSAQCSRARLGLDSKSSCMRQHALDSPLHARRAERIYVLRSSLRRNAEYTCSAPVLAELLVTFQ